MANPYPGSVSLSTAGVSAQINLDPTARTTTVLLNLNALMNSTGTCDVTVQQTYDSPLSGVTQVWAAVSTTHYSSAWDTSTVGSGTGTLLTITGPVAGLRLASTTFSSASATGVTMKALQSITAGP